MKLVVFGAVVLACAIPAFGQDARARHQQPGAQASPGVAGSRTPHHDRDNCRPAMFVPPGVTGWIVVPAFPNSPSTYGPAGSTQWSSTTPTASIFSQPSSGIGSIDTSGIGSMERSGIGAMQSSGIGMMERSGIGGIGMPSAGPAPNTVAQPTAPPLPTCR